MSKTRNKKRYKSFVVLTLVIATILSCLSFIPYSKDTYAATTSDEQLFSGNGLNGNVQTIYEQHKNDNSGDGIWSKGGNIFWVEKDKLGSSSGTRFATIGFRFTIESYVMNGQTYYPSTSFCIDALCRNAKVTTPNMTSGNFTVKNRYQTVGNYEYNIWGISEEALRSRFINKYSSSQIAFFTTPSVKINYRVDSIIVIHSGGKAISCSAISENSKGQLSATNSNSGYNTLNYTEGQIEQQWKKKTGCNRDFSANYNKKISTTNAGDTTRPTVSASISPSGWCKSATISGSAYDDSKGIGLKYLYVYRYNTSTKSYELKYSAPISNPKGTTSYSYKISTNDSATYLIRAMDYSNNYSDKYVTSYVDVTAPTSSLSGFTNNAWYSSPVTIKYALGDNLSGVSSAAVKNGSGTTLITSNGGTYTISSNGTHTFTASATDKAGNTTTNTYKIYYDNTKPTLNGLKTSSSSANTVTFECTLADTYSGLNNYYVTNSSGTKVVNTNLYSASSKEIKFTLNNGTYTLYVYDVAGNCYSRQLVADADDVDVKVTLTTEPSEWTNGSKEVTAEVSTKFNDTFNVRLPNIYYKLYSKASYYLKNPITIEANGTTTTQIFNYNNAYVDYPSVATTTKKGSVKFTISTYPTSVKRYELFSLATNNDYVRNKFQVTTYDAIKRNSSGYYEFRLKIPFRPDEDLVITTPTMELMGVNSYASIKPSSIYQYRIIMRDMTNGGYYKMNNSSRNYSVNDFLDFSNRSLWTPLDWDNIYISQDNINYETVGLGQNGNLKSTTFSTSIGDKTYTATVELKLDGCVPEIEPLNYMNSNYKGTNSKDVEYYNIIHKGNTEPWYYNYETSSIIKPSSSTSTTVSTNASYGNADYIIDQSYQPTTIIEYYLNDYHSGMEKYELYYSPTYENRENQYSLVETVNLNGKQEYRLKKDISKDNSGVYKLIVYDIAGNVNSREIVLDTIYKEPASASISPSIWTTQLPVISIDSSYIGGAYNNNINTIYNIGNYYANPTYKTIIENGITKAYIEVDDKDNPENNRLNVLKYNIGGVHIDEEELANVNFTSLYENVPSGSGTSQYTINEELQGIQSYLVVVKNHNTTTNQTITRYKVLNSYLDTTKPTLDISYNSEWSREDVTINANAYDELSGVREMKLWLGSGTPGSAVLGNTWTNNNINSEGMHTSEYSISPYTITSEGITQGYISVLDAAQYNDGISHNSTTYQPFTVKIDKSAPTVSGLLDKYESEIGYADMNVTLSDSVSGIASYTVKNVNGYVLGSKQLNGDASTTITYRFENAVGEYFIEVTDVAGNTYTTDVFEVDTDKTGPTIEVDEVFGWTLDDVFVEFYLEDLGSGLKEVYVTKKDDDTRIFDKTYTNTEYTDESLMFTTEQNTTYVITGIDMRDNVSKKEFIVRIDRTNPIPFVTGNFSQWGNGDVTIEYGVTDTLSGPNKATIYDKDGNIVTEHIYDETMEHGSYTFEESGIFDLILEGSDNSGLSARKEFTIMLDKIIPTSNIAISNDKWVNNQVTITTTGADTLSGVKEVFIEMYNGTEWEVVVNSTTDTVSFTYSTPGVTKFRAYSVDNVGNISEYTDVVEAKIDKTLPVGSITSSLPNENGELVLSITTSDEGGSELKDISLVRVENGVETTVVLTEDATFTHTIKENDTVYYKLVITDNAGNVTTTSNFGVYKQSFNHYTHNTNTGNYDLYKVTSQTYGQNTLCDPTLYEIAITGYTLKNTSNKTTVTNAHTHLLYYNPLEYTVHFINKYFGTVTKTLKYDEIFYIPMDNDKIFNITLDYCDPNIENQVLQSGSKYLGYKDADGNLLTGGTQLSKLSLDEDVYFNAEYDVSEQLALPEIPDTEQAVSVGWFMQPQDSGNTLYKITVISPTKDTTLYAYWNLRPTISTGTGEDYYRNFYNNQTVSNKELLFNILSNDLEDTRLSVKIEKIIEKKKDGSEVEHTYTGSHMFEDSTNYKIVYSVVDKGTTIGTLETKVARTEVTTEWYKVLEKADITIITMDKYIICSDNSITEANIENVLTNAQKVVDSDLDNDVSYWLKIYALNHITIDSIECDGQVYTDDITKKLIELKNKNLTSNVTVTYTANGIFGKNCTATGKVFFVSANDDKDIAENNSYISVRFINLKNIETLKQSSNWKENEELYNTLLETLNKDKNSEVKAEGEYKSKTGRKLKFKRLY